MCNHKPPRSNGGASKLIKTIDLSGRMEKLIQTWRSLATSWTEPTVTPVEEPVTPIEEPVAIIEPVELAEPEDQDSDIWETFHNASEDELWEYSTMELRKYARFGLGVVGASKIPGGKGTLIPLILEKRVSR